MSQNASNSADPAPNANPDARPLSPEAQRALAEAAERRKAIDAAREDRPEEVGGRGGLDPARYGDWEKDGIVSDF